MSFVRRIIFIPLAVWMFTFACWFYYRFYIEWYFNPFVYTLGSVTLGVIFLIIGFKGPPLSSRERDAVFAISLIGFSLLIFLFITQSQATYRIEVESNTNWLAFISWYPAHTQANIFSEKSWSSTQGPSGTGCGNKTFEIRNAREVHVDFLKFKDSEGKYSGFVRVKVYRNGELIEDQEISSKIDWLCSVTIFVELPFPFGGDIWGGSSSVIKYPPDTEDLQEIP